MPDSGGVLKGVVPFFGEMSQAITIPVQEDFMCVTSFEGGTASTGKLTFRKDIDHDIEGRDVLILEDIIDSGSTLKLIVELFQARKPASIKICTLLDKPSGRKVDLEPDYTCFTIPAAFVVGFGLDYEDYYRNLPYVGVLKPAVYLEKINRKETFCLSSQNRRVFLVMLVVLAVTLLLVSSLLTTKHRTNPSILRCPSTCSAMKRSLRSH